ncbi:hypothetical protein BJV77DRAFT_310283 [Russula vinacea]|nr:hypothetical protein BJV77DRAFT_310283 [Russula vinacea]
MSTLLVLASKVEAAVQTYLEVRDSVDKKKWRKKLDKERASVLSEINRIKQETGESRPALHPTLVALFIVLSRDEDLGRITRSRLDRKQHKYFRRREVSPEDISNLLPPREGRWWEDLAEEAREIGRQDAHPAPSSAASVAPGTSVPPTASIDPAASVKRAASVERATTIDVSPSIPPLLSAASSRQSKLTVGKKPNVGKTRKGPNYKGGKRLRNKPEEDEVDELEEDGKNNDNDSNHENGELEDEEYDSIMVDNPPAPTRGSGRRGAARKSAPFRKRKNSSPPREASKRLARGSKAPP